MGLTLTTNPVGSDARKLFAGFQPVEFVFKREDLAVTTVTSGVGGAKINHAGDLTSVLSAGDYVYLYSEGTSYTYDGSFEIISIVAGEITVDTPYIEDGSGGYINYLKNYFVELQCIDEDFDDANLLPFSLESDGDAAGNITIDVSIMNDKNVRRGAIATGHLDEGVQVFRVKYREVYDGSAESFTVVAGKILAVLYAIDDPVEDEVINNLDVPKIYLGYPAALTIAITDKGDSTTAQLKYNELDINQNIIVAGSLGTNASDVDGFLNWKWLKNASVQTNTKYVNFFTVLDDNFDFKAGDFATPDFVVS